MIAWLEKHLLIIPDIVQQVLPFLLELRAMPTMLKIPLASLLQCQNDPDYVLVMQDVVEHVEMPTLEGGARDEDFEVVISTGGTTAAADASVTAASAQQQGPQPAAQQVRIVTRPQAGNGQLYFAQLHSWAGRSVGGFGRPAGHQGNGSHARHAHRRISSVMHQFNGTYVEEESKLV